MAGASRIEFDGDEQTGELVAPNTGKLFIFKTITKKGWQTMRVVFTRGAGAMNLADLALRPGGDAKRDQMKKGK